MSLSLNQTPLVRIVAGQALTNNLLRLLALSPSISISGGVGTADLDAGAVTAAKATPGAWFFTTTGGTSGVYTLPLNPALAALVDGALVVFKCHATNGGASTLNVNNLGAVNLTRNGAALLGGDLLINRCYMAVYSSTGPSWDVVSQLGNLGPRYAVATGSANAYVFTSSGTGYAAPTTATSLRGELVSFRVNFVPTGPCTLAVDALGAAPIVYPGQRPMNGGEWAVGDVATVTWNSVYASWQIVGVTGAKAPALIGACRNLLAFNNVATPDSKLDITADEAVVKGSVSGLPVLLESVSVTIDITASGANGLDTGVEAANTWYYVWLIWNGSTTAGLLSASFTTPTLPAGYTHRGLIGAVRNNAASNLVRFKQADRRIWTAESVVLAAKAAGVNDTWELLGGADATAFRAAVPVIGKACSGFVGTDNTTDVVSAMLAAVNEDGTLATDIIAPQLFQLQNMATAYNSLGGAAPFFDLPVRGAGSGNIQWKSRLTTLTVSLSVNGFTI